MNCKNCGKALIRGYSFCMECGTPVPAEVLEEGGLPGRSENESNGDMPSASVERTEEQSGPVAVSMPGVEPLGQKSEGTLVFCPNCGMRMQKSTDFCEKCGMALSEKPKSKMPTSSGGVPLVNTNPTGLDGGFGGFGGGIGGLGDFSDNDINQINNFMNGGGIDDGGYDGGAANGDIFGTSSYSANDIAMLNSQMSGFSASANEMPSIKAVGAADGIVRQKEPERGKERKVENFSMGGDYEEELELTDGAVPVIDGCSMDEDASADISLDPYAFLGNSMDDISEEPAPEPAPITFEKPAEPEPPKVTPISFEKPEAPAAEAVDFGNIYGNNEEETPEPVSIEKSEEPETPAAEAVSFDNIYGSGEEEAKPVNIEKSEEPEAPAAEAVSFDNIYGSGEEEAEPVNIEKSEEPETPAAEAVSFDNIYGSGEEEAEPVNIEKSEEAETPAAAAAVVLEKPAEAAEETNISENTENMDNNLNETENTYTPPVEDDFVPEEMAFIEESAPEPEPAPAPVPTPAPAYEAPREEIPVRRPEPAAAPENPKGNLVYCRNCGQDMYDTEKFCKNCNAPYKGAYVPPKNAPSKTGSKPPVKVFGVFPLSSFIGGCAALVVVVGIIIFLAARRPETPPVGGEVLSSSTSSTVSDIGESTSSSTSSAAVSTTTSSSSSAAVSTETSSKEQSSDTSTPDEPSSSSSSSSSSQSSSSSKSSSSSVVKPPVSTGAMSAKVSSLEKDREKIMSAAAQIAGEVGKIDALAQNVMYAIDSSSSSPDTAMKAFYARDFAKGMLSVINSGNSSMSSVVNSAKPSNSELNSAYTSLKSLKARYDAYYKYIKSPTNGSDFAANCSSYMNNFNSALKSLSLNTFVTSSYTAGNKNYAYATMVSEAVKNARNSANQLSALQTTMTNLGSKFESNAAATLAKNTKTYSAAAGYAMQMHAYAAMLSGVSSGYSGALTYLNTSYSSLQELIETYSYIQENSLSNFRNESSGAISRANSNANSAAYIIS